MELENCSQPAIITKDVCMLIYARDSKVFINLIRYTIYPNLRLAQQVAFAVR